MLSNFSNYLCKRKTQYFWNNFSSPSFDINVGIEQESALFPILSTLYLLPFLYILENWLNNIKIPISFLSFVDNELLVSQSKSFHVSNSYLFCSYNIASKLLLDFGLVVKHSKTEIFHFSRSIGLFNPSPLNLFPIGGPILHPKETWKYLGFIFDRKLSFHYHIDFYVYFYNQVYEITWKLSPETQPTSRTSIISKLCPFDHSL